MTCSLFSSSNCDRIAPNPSFEASVNNVNGFEKSRWTNIGAEHSCFLSFSKASVVWLFQVIATPHLSICQSGCMILANEDMKHL